MLGVQQGDLHAVDLARRGSLIRSTKVVGGRGDVGAAPVAGQRRVEHLAEPVQDHRSRHLGEQRAVDVQVVLGVAGDRRQVPRCPSTGDPARWDLIVTAVCATKPAGWTKLVKVGTIDTADYKGANTLSCPTGTQAYGGAGGVGSFIPGDAHLLQFATIRGTRWQSVTAAWSHPTKAWFATVAVFCAR